MEAKVRCPKCSLALTVDRLSTGKPARCPACGKVFKIPEAEDLLDDTISSWIEEDVDEEITERDYQKLKDRANREYYQNLEAKKLAEEEEEERRMQEQLAEARDKLAASRQEIDFASTEPASEEVRAESDASSVRPTINLGDLESGDASASGAQEKPDAASTEPRVISEENDEIPLAIPVARPRSKYPKNPIVDRAIPHLIVTDCSADGVELGFDSQWLRHEGFRNSLPVSCAFTGERERDRLRARPMIFADQTDGQVSRVYKAEAGFERPLVAGQSTGDLLKVMGTIDYMPEPFNLILPYFVTESVGKNSLRCRTQQRSDSGITCFVQYPNGEYALEWLRNVNGVCGPEFQLLEDDVRKMAYADAQVVSDVCRERLSAWVKFMPLERLLLYVRDTDILSRDDGLGGIVVTNRRMVFHKNRHHGEIAFDEEAKIIVNTDETVTNVFLEMYGERTRVGKTRPAQSHELIDALKGAPKFKITQTGPAE